MMKRTLDTFIKDQIVEREISLFRDDMEAYNSELENGCNGKSFLIIGGAGTIGSSYLKAILPFRPKHITVVDYNENGLTELIRDLRSTNDLHVPGEFITYPFDFGSPLLEKVLQKHHFDVIACFGAHKHVRSEKDVIAVEAMFRNNVFNTAKLLSSAVRHQPEHFFAVSTDKASNPVNIMGGTKKMMENLILSYATSLKVATARFANVAFSSGSLLDGFIYRLANQQPITAPDDVKRYFVTPEESGQICMLASLLGQTGDIFFPKLEEKSMKSFSTIATAFLAQSGLNAELCGSEEEAKIKASKRKESDTYYPVYYFSSDTTGEKSFEEFFTPDETTDFKSYKALGIVKNTKPFARIEMEEQLNAFHKLFLSPELQKSQIVDLMKKYIPDFDHKETGKYLDSKM